MVVTRAWNPEIRTHHDTKLALGKEVKVEKYPTHEVHYLPFRPGMLDWAYLNFGETWLRLFFFTDQIVGCLFGEVFTSIYLLCQLPAISEGLDREAAFR